MRGLAASAVVAFAMGAGASPARADDIPPPLVPVNPTAVPPPAPAPSYAPQPAPTYAPQPAPTYAPPPAPRAEPSHAAPAAAQPEKDPDEVGRPSLTQLGVGLAYVNVAPLASSRSARASEAGLLLELSRTTPLSEKVDFGLRFAWGLTAWERFPRWAKAGYDAGRWTTEAYENTYNYTRKRGPDGTYDPNLHGLRLMGGFFGMMFLWIGYVASGIAYVTAVLAPTTFLEMDATANYNFGDPSPKGVNPYLKAGVALMAFVHPEHGRMVGAVGPTLGGGVRIGTLHLGLTGTWSPAGLHGEAREGRSHIVTGGLTIGVQR